MSSTRSVVLMWLIPAACIIAFAQGNEPVRTHVEALPGGQVALHVENISPRLVTALVVVGKRVLSTGQSDTSVRFFDSVLSPVRKPLRLGETTDFKLFGRDPSSVQVTRSVQVKGALFDDGTSWGDPNWTAVLVCRRAYVRDIVVKTLSEINDMAAGDVTRSDALAQLRLDRDNALQNARDIDQKQMADVVLTNALATITEPVRADGSTVPLQESLRRAKEWLVPLRDRIDKSGGQPK